LAFLGKGGLFPLLLGVLLLLFRRTRKGGLCVLLAVGVGALFTNVFIKNAVARPRPYQDGAFAAYREFWEFVGSHTESEWSFPSGHATVITTSMMAIFLSFNKKWSWAVFFFPLLTGASRVYLGVHYATDVLGGFIIGAIAGTIAFFITKGIYKLINSHKENKFCSFVLGACITDLFKKKQENQE
jgi:undecaprenyl-diphosphatase